MSILGIGPLLLIVGAVTALVVLGVQRLMGVSVSLAGPYTVWASWLGVGMMVIGVFFWATGGLLVKRAYEGHRLVTTGVYRVTRNPMYTGIIVFIIPGLVLVLSDLLFLLVPVAMIIAFKALIGREEEHLRKEFGPAFEKYRKSVNQVLPSFPHTGR